MCSFTYKFLFLFDKPQMTATTYVLSLEQTFFSFIFVALYSCLLQLSSDYDSRFF